MDPGNLRRSAGAFAMLPGLGGVIGWQFGVVVPPAIGGGLIGLLKLIQYFTGWDSGIDGVLSSVRLTAAPAGQLGQMAAAIVRHGVSESETSFLQKPFTPDTLAR